MKKLLMSAVLSMGILLGGVRAQTDGPDSFQIEVRPSVLQQNSPADIIVKAMKNGNVYSNYTGDVYLDIEGMRRNDYTLPNGGWYQFVSEDMGKKTFNKGLEIKKSGTFTIAAEDYNGIINGSLTVKVENGFGSSDPKLISIIYPQPNSTVFQEDIMMAASSLALPSSPAKIYLNDTVVSEVSSDAEGNINASLRGLRQGNNTLQVSITSLEGEEIGKSEKITFAYAPLGSNLFKGIKATPNTGLVRGDLVTFDVTTDPMATSVVVFVGTGWSYPADKVADGKFTRPTIIFQTGIVDISVEVGVKELGELQLSTGVLQLFVDEETKINNVTFKLDPQTMKDLEMSWSVIGKPASFFEIKYGTGIETLDQILETDRKAVIFHNIDTTKQRFFQITPLLWAEKSHGSASDIYDWMAPTPPKSTTETEQPSSSWPSAPPSGPVVVELPGNQSLCSVKGIRVTTQKIGGKYYLVRWAVPEVISYTVYMGETPDATKKKKLIDTTETRYEYPFDLSSEEDIFAYFWVEATCDDGQVMQLTGAKKVQVWPAENILLLVCLSLLIYAGIRLYRYSE